MPEKKEEKQQIYVTTIKKCKITICWASLAEIRGFMAAGNYVFVGQSYDDPTRRHFLQSADIEAGPDHRLNEAKLKNYEGRVSCLLVVVIAPEAKLYDLRDMFQLAMRWFYTGVMENPAETAHAFRENIHELLGVYLICHDFVRRIKKNFAAAVLIDKELANYIGQFASSSLSLLRYLKLVFAKRLAGDNRFLEAFRKLPEPNDSQARHIVKCLLEAIELALQLEEQTNYSPERLANLSFAAVLLECGSWSNNQMAGQAARGAALYEQMRQTEPELPKVIAHFILYQDIITAQTPNLFEVAFKDQEGGVLGLAYRAHAFSDARENIRAEIEAEAGYLTTEADRRPEFSVRLVRDAFAFDLLSLALVKRFVTEAEKKTRAGQIIADMAAEITQPYPERDLEKALVAEPTLYAKVLAALGRAHNLVLPKGAVALLLNTKPENREAVKHLGLAGSYALCLGKALWILSDRREPGKLLSGPFDNAIAKIWLPGSGQLCQGIIKLDNPQTIRMYNNNATLTHFLPANVMRDFLARHREAVLPYLQ